MNKLLVPLDLSDSYQNILRYAVSLASKSKAELTLFYVGSRRFLKNRKTLSFTHLEEPKSFFSDFKENALGENIKKTISSLIQSGIQFKFKSVNGSVSRRVLKECKSDEYNLVIIGTDSPGIFGNYRKTLATEILEEVNIPTFVVPASSAYNEIDHITYAVDLSEYDPKVIRQVKAIASMFDAKLTIAHVNQETEGDNSEYIKSLEQTIADTLDYPKVYYNFFDHADILTGIQKLVSNNNTNLVAMTNRHATSWKDFFTGKGLTRKMVNDSTVPLLAFHKS